MKDRSLPSSVAHFLAPSASGVLGYVVITGLVWLSHDITSVRRYLQIPDDFSVGQGVLDVMNDVLVRLLGAHVNTLVLGLLWALVGLVVYVITMEIVQGLGELREDVQARHYVWASGRNRNQPLENWLQRTGVRVATATALLFYLIYIVGYVTDWRVGAGMAWQRWLGTHELFATIYFLLISLAVWHGFVLLLRLMTLRTRLFG